MVDFGCILNDTEVMRPGRMTNNSPLPVCYSWFFLKRPPVVRQDPELLDEGVDMESDYESTEEEAVTEITEITEEEEEEEEEVKDGGSGEGGESRESSEEELVSDGSSVGVGKERGEGGEGEEREESEREKEEGTEQREESEREVTERGSSERVEGKEEEVKEVKEVGIMEMANQVSVVVSAEGEGVVERAASQLPDIKEEDPVKEGESEEEEGLDLHVKINSEAAVLGGEDSEHSSHHVASKVSSTHESGVPTSEGQTQLSVDGGSETTSKRRKRRKKKKKAPWELAFDPFKPIPISQVS